MGNPGTGRKHGIILAAKVDPITILGDAYGKDIVFALVNVVQNRFCGAQRNLMLRADAAEENTNAEFFHIIASFYIRIHNYHLEFRKIGVIIWANTLGGVPCKSN
jgi:hypothetical protein